MFPGKELSEKKWLSSGLLKSTTASEEMFRAPRKDICDKRSMTRKVHDQWHDVIEETHEPIPSQQTTEEVQIISLLKVWRNHVLFVQ